MNCLLRDIIQDYHMDIVKTNVSVFLRPFTNMRYGGAEFLNFIAQSATIQLHLMFPLENLHKTIFNL